MKKIAVSLLLLSSSVALADGGAITVEAKFSVTAPPVCVPTGRVDLTFADIDNQTTSTTFAATAAKTMTLTNCPVGSLINVSGTSNMRALDGSNVLSTVGDSAEGLIGLAIYASATTATVASSNVFESSGANLTIATANQISVFGALKSKNNGSGGVIKAVKAGSYTITAPLTVTVR